MRFLGIDYGTKRIGLAISDEEGRMAFPLKILKNDKETLDNIHNICGELDITEIVIGESLDSKGKENAVMSQISKFKKELEFLKLPIHFEKEFFTTTLARGKEGKEKNTARKTKKTKQESADAKAAMFILQRYLDRRNN